MPKTFIVGDHVRWNSGPDEAVESSSRSSRMIRSSKVNLSGPSAGPSCNGKYSSTLNSKRHQTAEALMDAPSNLKNTGTERS